MIFGADLGGLGALLLREFQRFAVAINCADTACMPVASSSVKLALRTRSGLPQCSTNFFTRVGPSPCVRESASQEVASREFSVAKAVVDLSPEASRERETTSTMALTLLLLEFVKR